MVSGLILRESFWTLGAISLSVCITSSIRKEYKLSDLDLLLKVGGWGGDGLSLRKREKLLRP